MVVLDAIWIAYACVSAALGLYAVHRLALTVQAARSPNPRAEAADPHGDVPVVTVQLPLYNERFVAERLIDAACRLDWPRDRLEIQVLDDSTDDTAELCRELTGMWRSRGIDIHYLHRDDRTGYKAGALQAGLERARGQFVLVLDADFVADPDLLQRTIGHFADERVAMVQARWAHLNREQGALTELQALLLDGHFAVEQHGRAGYGRFFNFNGTAGLWRARAIFESGGWHGDTLTEDLDLSYRAQLRGWQFVYLCHEQVAGELPADIRGFKSQQFRWAKGSVQVARKLLVDVWRAPVPVRVKLEAAFHLTHNLPYLLSALLALLAVPALVWRGTDSDLALWLQLALVLGAPVVLAVYVAASQKRIGGWAAVWPALYRVPSLMALTAGMSLSQSRAVLEGLCGTGTREFVRTPKEGQGGRNNRAARRRYRRAAGWMPWLEIACAIYLAVGTGWAVGSGQLGAAPILAVFAIGFFVVGVATLAGPRVQSPAP